MNLVHPIAQVFHKLLRKALAELTRREREEEEEEEKEEELKNEKLYVKGVPEITSETKSASFPSFMFKTLIMVL